MLLLCYEDMRGDPAGTVQRVAEFIGVELDEGLLELTLERSSMDYMLANRHRYDDRLMRELSEHRIGLPPGSDSAKVRRGETGAHERELTPAIEGELARIWAEEIAGPFGLADYGALRTVAAAVPARH